MDDLYAKESEDTPYDSQEVRFWSVKTMFKFLIVGLPRIFVSIIGYIVLIILYYICGKNEEMFTFFWKWFGRFKLQMGGFKKLDISKETKEIFKNSKSQILICKHCSYMDPLICMFLFPDAVFIASHFMNNIPIFGKIIEKRCIFLKDDFRGDLTKEIKNKLDEGKRIIFFSEGVCSHPNFLLKLRSGAFVPRLDILPIHINYDDNKHWVKGENDMMSHLLSLLSNRNNKVTVRAIPDYILSNEEKTCDIEILKENFRKYYAKGFDIKLSNKSYKEHTFYRFKVSENNSEKN